MARLTPLREPELRAEYVQKLREIEKERSTSVGSFAKQYVRQQG